MDDRPRLRPLDAYPVTLKGKPHLRLRDSSRLSEYQVTLPPEAVAVVQLLDGESTRDEICAQFKERYRRTLARDALDDLLDQLDKALLLDTERFRQYSAGVFAEFARSPVRLPLFAGQSYPAKASELRQKLDGYFDPPNGPGRANHENGPRPKAIIAPHVDFPRGGAAYAWAYRPLADSAADPPELVIVLGTDHAGVEQPFTLTRKHYETPLGRIETDVDLVDELAKDAEDALFSDEHHHRGEHAIEFQMVWLRHVYGKAGDDMKALPILCGSLHQYIVGKGDPAAAANVGGFLSRLSSLVAGRKVLWIAAADLAHVGPQYGDAEPLDAADRASLEKRDQETLEHVVRGDAAGWLASIRREQDRRRVCGLSPIYSLLAAAEPGAGRLAAYAQCAGEPGSIVSIASLVF